MLRNDWKQILTQASFTVEAAMIMGIVLYVILAVLYGTQIVYNRAVMTAHAYEVAITGREKEAAALWGQPEDVISIELEELEPVSFLRKAQFIVSE